MTVRDRPRADTTMTRRVPAHQNAIEVLLDQRVFNLDAVASEAFARALDHPPAPNAALRALMAERAPWK